MHTTGPAVKNHISSEMARALHESTETENKTKNEDFEEVQSNLVHDLPDWLQEFRDNAVGERNPSEPR